MSWGTGQCACAELIVEVGEDSNMTARNEKRFISADRRSLPGISAWASREQEKAKLKDYSAIEREEHCRH